MCFWSDMEGERLESFLNIIYQYTIFYQNLNLKIYGRILNIFSRYKDRNINPPTTSKQVPLFLLSEYI